ncbi:MAG: hypothetical protein GF334_02415 [Candidatus Altiarchaeales archaeon]|nr:hypothetical protein [Candidatus Altiarchaeales archaeon]
MKHLVSDVGELKKHVKESQLGYRQAIIDYYKCLGESQGYTASVNAAVVRYLWDYGSVDLAWIEPNTTFNLEFGVLEDVYKHLIKNLVLDPEYVVLVLNSKAKCLPEKVLELVSKTPCFKRLSEKIVLVDVA